MPPIVIAAAISGGAAIAGGVMASKSANKAANQQVQATDQGLALQKQIYDEQKAGMQPYAQFGQQALGSLGSLLGFPAPPPQAAARTGQWPGFEAPRRDPALGPLTPQELAIKPTMVPPTGSNSFAGNGSLGSMTSSYRSPANGRDMAPPMAAPSGGSFTTGGGVRMKSPTGEVALIPPDQVSQFEQRGAQRI